MLWSKYKHKITENYANRFITYFVSLLGKKVLDEDLACNCELDG